MKGIFQNNIIGGCCLLVFMLLISQTAYSFQFGNLEAKTGIKVSGEYDDNTNLKNKDVEETKEDFVLHIEPGIELLFPYQEHTFSLDVRGDYRKGISEDLSDFNMYATGAVELVFPMGLDIGLKNEYNDTNFDNAIYNEAGTSKTKNNISTLDFDYTLVDRLRAEGEYNHKWEEIENEASAPEERDMDNIKGKFSIPVTDSIVSYLSVFFETQNSDEDETRNYDDNRFLAGMKWKGPYRFTIWGESGYEKIEFDHQEMEDYSTPVGKIGVDINFTESSTGKLSVGRDGYENTVYEGDFEYISPSEDTTVGLSISKRTQISFSTLYPSGALEMTNFNARLTQKNIFSRFTLDMNGNYQIQESYSDNIIREDKIWLGKLSLDYPIQEWLRVGTHYQYSQRDSKLRENEYKDNRVGLFVLLTH